MNKDLVSYYKDRAKEYEKVYLKPERQSDLAEAESFLQKKFTGKTVTEIACGTGFWTERIAVSASSVHATDINKEVIEIAERKQYPKSNVTFATANVFNNEDSETNESLFAGFIWSHIELNRLDDFVTAINAKVMPGGLVVLMDNNYVEGSNTPIVRTDSSGNTYQVRKLEDGTLHEVLKNFPSIEFLLQTLRNKGTAFEYVSLKYFWLLAYQTVT
jgi:demethylmenaquinone methyltransferase/2-methoxy-6-polyprenyl-1,4-benzoquinol methylase